MEFISHKLSTQGAFCNIFAAAAQAGTPVVVTSLLPPWELPVLMSFFEQCDNGVFADIPHFDAEDLRAVTAGIASRLGLQLPGSCVAFISEHVRNCHGINGILRQLAANSIFANAEIDIGTLIRAKAKALIRCDVC